MPEQSAPMPSPQFARCEALVLPETHDLLKYVSDVTGWSVRDLAGLCIDVGMRDRDSLTDYLGVEVPDGL